MSRPGPSTLMHGLTPSSSKISSTSRGERWTEVVPVDGRRGAEIETDGSVQEHGWKLNPVRLHDRPSAPRAASCGDEDGDGSGLEGPERPQGAGMGVPRPVPDRPVEIRHDKVDRRGPLALDGRARHRGA